MGAIDPHLGEIWGFENLRIFPFSPTLAHCTPITGSRISDFSTPFARSLRHLLILKIRAKSFRRKLVVLANKVGTQNFRVLGTNLGRRGTLTEGPTPDLTHVRYRPGDSNKNFFERGRSPPIRGRYGGLKIVFLRTLAHFHSITGSRIFDFSTPFARSQGPLLMLKI